MFNLLPYGLFAQEKQRKIEFVGSVIDSFTGWGLGDAGVTVYNEADSMVCRAFLVTFGGRERNGNEFHLILPREKKRYRIHVECARYFPTDYWLEVNVNNKKSVHKIPPIALKKDFKSKSSILDKDTELGEAVVKATKIKMYHKGDTIVYNADAFNLPEGSMLDDLIKQLPGARLTEAGEIFVNGRKIDMLMLNGKDFFSHNKKIMLENLPYYTIQTLKVYDESTVRSKALGHDVDDKLHVMDVQLKKEYSIGYMGNVEAGGGTYETWLARLFGLRFSDNSRTSVFYNGNDINESKKPDADGNINLKLDGTESGQQTRHTGGAEILVDDKMARWTENANVTFGWNKVDNESRSWMQTFLPQGDVFAESHDLSSSKNLEFNVDNVFRLKKPFFLESQTLLNVRNNDRHGERKSVSFDTKMDTVNSSIYGTEGDGRIFTVDQKLKFMRNLPDGNDVEADISAGYHHETRDEFSRQELRYKKESQRDELRHRFNRMPQHGYNLSAGALYRLNLVDNLSMALHYRFTYTQENQDNTRNILESLSNEDGLSGLPDDAVLTVDPQNSYLSDLRTQLHRMEVSITKSFKIPAGFQDRTIRSLGLSLPVSYRHDTYDYRSASLQTVRKRDLWLFEPNMGFSWNRLIRCHLTMMVSPSAMSQLIPYEYNYNPLAIYQGNPDLKNQKTYCLNTNYYPRIGKWHFWISCNGYIYQDKVVNTFTYENLTGVYTYRPINVNGTWRYVQYFKVDRPLDKHRNFNFSNQLMVQYDHQVDMMSSDGDVPGKSVVKNTRLEDELSVNYSKGTLSAALQAKYGYIHIQGDRPAFVPINAHDIRYGGYVNYTLPFKLSVTSSLYMYSRRGFNDKRMNTDNLVWNASIGYPFLKGRLVAHIDAFDLLHRISNVSYSVSSYGRTETWNRALPNYFLFRLQWKFNRNPKKK